MLRPGSSAGWARARRANIKVSSTETGAIFGNVVYEATGASERSVARPAPRPPGGSDALAGPALSAQCCAGAAAGCAARCARFAAFYLSRSGACTGWLLPGACRSAAGRPGSCVPAAARELQG